MFWTGKALKDEGIEMVRRSGFLSDSASAGSAKAFIQWRGCSAPTSAWQLQRGRWLLENACADFQPPLPGILQKHAQNGEDDRDEEFLTTKRMLQKLSQWSQDLE